MMAKQIKNITIDQLAGMMKTSFESLSKEFKQEMDVRFGEFRKEMRNGFAEVNTRLDRIENKLIPDHDRRIEKLEDKMLQVQVILGKKLT